MEKWKVVKGFEDYEVSNKGNVRSLKFGKEKILKPGIDRKGYLRVGLCKNGIRKNFRVHRLVAQAFIENPDNKPVINHLDNNPSNNRLENLEWNSQKENVQHCINQGRVDRKGEKNGLSKLTLLQVNEIRSNLNNLKQRELASKYNISISSISAIKKYRNWK